MGKRKKQHPGWSKAVMILLFLVGSLIMFYPFYIDALNHYLDQVRMENYQKKEKIEYEEQQGKLAKENEKLAESGLSFGADPFEEVPRQQVSKEEYEEHLIGQVNIPKLAIDIPLFDTTTADFLEVGATVINGTSFPVGGESTHSVISAHRGLPERELFTNLPKLIVGDLFLLNVLGETLAYEVDRIEVVEPTETSSLKIVSDADLVTLVTCTPYMINSHRLLVTGHRVPYTPVVAKEVAKGNQFRQLKQWGILGGMTLIVLGSLYLFIRVLRLERLRSISFDLALTLPEFKNSEVRLYNRKGKKVLLRQGSPLVTQADERGSFRFDNLPGGIYQLAFSNQTKKIKAGIKKKGQQPKLYLSQKEKRSQGKSHSLGFET